MFGILVFGDSIAWGRGDNEHAGWTGRLKNEFEQRDYYNVMYNLAISGNTTTDLLERFDTEAKARIRYKRDEDRFAIIIAIGTNDSRFLGNTDTPQTRPADFEENIKELLEKAKQYTKEVYMMGIIPVDEEKTNPYEQKFFLNERIKLFNDLIKKSCAEKNIPFLDLYEQWSKENYQSLLGDGLHPHAEGYEKMYGAIKQFLEEQKVL